MRKLGAIDIGTNSIRLLIATVEDGKILKSYKDLETTRIGENVDKTGSLSEAAMERSLKALEKFVDMARKEGIQDIPVIATSAVRDAQNREEFLERALEKTGIRIQVISGEEEARLGFSGVIKGLKKGDENFLVIDIGGGSTEFIWGNSLGIQHMTSLNVGAVRMTEKCMLEDPPSWASMQCLEREIEDVISSTLQALRPKKIDRLIGIGGTATTIASVHLGLKVYDRDKVHNTDLNLVQVREILERFSSVSLEERRQIPGLHPKRADVIVAGTVILDRILTGLDMDALRISEYDNLEGMVLEQLD